MLREPINAFRAFVISPETIVCLLGIGSLLWYQYIPRWIGLVVRPIEPGYLAAPIGLLVTGVAWLIFGVLLPPVDEGRRDLAQWPDYSLLRGRCIAAAGWAVVEATAMALATFAKPHFSDVGLGSLYATALLSALVTLATCGLALVRVRAALAGDRS